MFTKTYNISSSETELNRRNASFCTVSTIFWVERNSNLAPQNYYTV